MRSWHRPGGQDPWCLMALAETAPAIGAAPVLPTGAHPADPRWGLGTWPHLSEPPVPRGHNDASRGCLRMKLEETMVIKAFRALRGVTQLLAITRNYKPQAPGRGGCGVRPPPTLQLEMRPEPEAWAGQLEAGVPAHRLPALGNTAVSAEMCRTPQRVRPLRGKEWVTLTSLFLLWSALPPAWAGGQRLPCAQPWPSVTLSRACPLSLPPCPRASWARTCLRSSSFAGNPWARPRLPAAPAQLCSDLPSALMGPG